MLMFPDPGKVASDIQDVNMQKAFWLQSLPAVQIGTMSPGEPQITSLFYQGHVTLLTIKACPYLESEGFCIHSYIVFLESCLSSPTRP